MRPRSSTEFAGLAALSCRRHHRKAKVPGHNLASISSPNGWRTAVRLRRPGDCGSNRTLDGVTSISALRHFQPRAGLCPSGHPCRSGCSTKSSVTARLPSHQQKTEETMNIDRRQLALPALAVGLLGVVLAFAASADEDAVAKSVEAFRAA